MNDLLPITLADQIACVKREIAMRERVYPRRIADRLMTERKASLELAHMRAVLQTLQDAAGRKE